MNKETDKKTLILYGITLITALVVLIDFTWPGKVFIEDVIAVKKHKEKYFNAGGNSHYSYRVITSQHDFSISEDFAKSVQNNKIKYSESFIFKEINRYRLTTSEKSTIYSFRIVSGLALPLIVIFTILIAYKYQKPMRILIFVLQVSLLTNVIILVL